MSNRHPLALTQRTSTWLLLLIVLLAAALRLYQLSGMPPGLYHDEAYYGLDALSLTQGKTFPQFYEGWELYQHDAHADRPAQQTRWPLFFEGNYGREPLHIYLVALSIKLLGVTPFAIRIVPALLGTLAVYTTFLAAKALLVDDPTHTHGRRLTLLTPLMAAFTLAVLLPVIHFSRFGLRLMTFLPIATLTVYAFAQGLNHSQTASRRPSWHYFLLAGFLLGLGLYSYAAGRLFPLLFILFVPLWFWLDRTAWAAHWRHIALMATTAVAVAAPLLFYFWQYPYFFLFRMAYVSNRGAGAVEGKPWLTWLLNVWRVVGGIFWQGETHLRHNLPARPYLDPWQAGLFLLGTAVSLKRLAQPRTYFLLLWLLVMLLPTVLSGDAPHFGRMVGAAPVLAIFIGLGFEKASHWLRPKPVLVLFLLLSLAGSALLTIYDYFGRYAHHPQLATDFYLPEWQMGRYAASFSPTTAVYLSPTQEELATLYYALADPDRLQNYAGEAGAVPLGFAGQEALYLLRPSAQLSLQNLQAAFPSGQLSQPDPTYLSFVVPANAPRQLGQHASDHRFADAIQLMGWQVDSDPNGTAVTLIWQALAPLPLDYTVFVHLLDSQGTAVAQLDRPPGGYPTSDWRPGEWILDRYLVPTSPGLDLADLTIQTGFYDLATLARLGQPATLIPD